MVDVILKPERYPAERYSILMAPHCCIRSLSTTNVRPSCSRVESVDFGSSRANPSEGPDQPPCMRATRMDESILFSVIYDFKELIAISVTSSIALSSKCALLRTVLI